MENPLSFAMSTILIISAVAGLLLGRIAAGWAAAVLFDVRSTKLAVCPACSHVCSRRQRWFSIMRVCCSGCGVKWTVRWPLLTSLVLAGLFAGFAWMLIGFQCQNVSEVQPASPMSQLRLPFHLALLFFLTVATLTDLLDYAIPDDVILVGILTAIIGATVSGDLQVIHVWVNWDSQVTGLYGPYLPEWMKHHQHLHGFVWSLAGLLVGASYVGFVRMISGWVLGEPAMGFGDVTLMAMIGAFIGWQPALCAIAIAPLTAVVFGLLARVLSGRSFVAFGPYLAISAVIVLCTWRWIWADPLLMRDIFSHWPSVAGMVGGSLVALAVLLGGLRMFMAMPADTIRR